ncbi:peptidylprolyl isomerase [Coraliomargarita sp. W4R53]
MPGLGMAVIVLGMVACSSQEEGEVADPVAIEVGESAIRLSELQAQLDFLASRRTPVASDSESFISDYVQRSIALIKARELGLDEDVEFQRQVENLLIGRLKQAQINMALESISVSDDEVSAYYEAHSDRYGRAAQARFALLHLPADKFADAAARTALASRLQEAQQLVSELPAGARGFGPLAMKYSEEATSRFKGGDIGWLKAGQDDYRWPEAVVSAAFRLQVGELSEIVETEDGAYLLLKTDAREAVKPTLDGRFRATLSQSLLREKRELALKDLEQEWAEGVPLQLHEDVLARLKFASPILQPSRTTEVTRSLP